MNKYYNDFELWCKECVTITDKLSGQQIPFTLNAPQRRVLNTMERQRLTGKPIRLIMLKARQWGGSTLVQTYMAWMQLVRHTGWNSLICAHVKDASANIRGMYSRLLRQYPSELKEGNTKDWSFVPFEKSINISHIPARDCQVAIATAQSPDGVRGGNYSMAHLSEVAFWGDDDWQTAEKIVRTVSGSIALEPDTLIVMESTANGEGNFFHGEWERAVAGKSDKTPIFVPWHEIEIYSRHVSNDERDKLIASFDDYERNLFLHHKVSLEHLAWYHDKRKEYTSHYQMMAEYPSTAEEAFASSGTSIFSAEQITTLKEASDKFKPKDFSPSLVALLPADKLSEHSRHTICLSGMVDNKVIIGKTIHSEASLKEILNKAFELCKHHSAPLLPIDCSTEVCGSSQWITRQADKHSIPLALNSDEDSMASIADNSIIEMLDNFFDLIDNEQLIICNPTDIESLRTARYHKNTMLNCSDKPFLIAGIVSANYFSERLNDCKLTPTDFL